MMPRFLLSALVWAGLAALPLVLGEWELSSFGQLLIYGMAAMSLSFIWGELGLVCFGQALFFGTGAYVMALTGKGMLPGVPDNAWLGVMLGALGGALVAALLGGALFFGKGLRTVYFGIVTIAAAVIAERLATNWRFIGGFNGLMDIPALPVAGSDTSDPVIGYLTVLVLAFLSWLGLLALQRAPIGTILRAIRCDEQRMQSLGYRVPLWKILGLGISGGTAGLAGALFAAQFAFVSPAVIGLALSTEILIWAAVGGKAVLLAAFLGGIGVKWVEATLSETIGPYWLFVIGMTFVAIIVLSPRGLLGRLLDTGLAARLAGPARR